MSTGLDRRHRAGQAVSGRWWDEPFQAFQTNIREIDAGLDVAEVLDFLEAYGADTWLLSVGGIIANYPSTLDCQTVNPALSGRDSGDLISDALAAAEGRGIRLLGRMDFSKIDGRRAEEHPEWCFVDRDGQPQIYNGYVSVCPSGEYYQQKMFDVITEVLGRYDLGGFFFNMMQFNERDYSRRYRGVCQCEPCRSAFRVHAPGVEHPTDPGSPGYAAWRTWAADVLDDLNVRMRQHVTAVNPDAALILRGSAHVTYHEANNAVGRPLWHHLTSESVSAHRSGERDRAIFVNCVGFVDMPYRWAGEDPNHFAQYLVQAIAHGGRPSTYVMGTPDAGRYQCLEVGGWITRFHRDHADVYRGLESDAEVALVRASHEEDQHRERRVAEFRGCYQSLVERHVPFDVVRRETLSAVAERYRLLILPDLGELAADEVAAIDLVLAGGGTVVATGDSGWRGARPQLAADTPLARQKARYATDEALFSLHVAVDASGDHAPVTGAFDVLEPASGAMSDWQVLGRSTYGPPEKCYGNRLMPHPGWVSGRVGDGQLAFVPWRPGQVYHDVGLQRVRDAWVAKALGLTGRRVELQIATDLPAQAQIVTGRNRAGDTVVHLLNRSGDAQQRFVEPLPIGPGTLRINTTEEPSRVRAHVADIDLDWTRDGEQLEIQTPTLGLFEVITVQAKPRDMRT